MTVNYPGGSVSVPTISNEPSQGGSLLNGQYRARDRSSAVSNYWYKSFERTDREAADPPGPWPENLFRRDIVNLSRSEEFRVGHNRNWQEVLGLASPRTWVSEPKPPMLAGAQSANQDEAHLRWITIEGRTIGPWRPFLRPDTPNPGEDAKMDRGSRPPQLPVAVTE